jgi:plasmid stabilization system protein ParE
MYDFALTSEAQRDLIAIQDYIAQDNPAAARHVIDQCFACFSKLAASPLLGHTREDLTSRAVRFWNVYSYMIVYDPQTNPISIIRVLSGYRDLSSLL